MATVSYLQLFVVLLALGQVRPEAGFEQGKRYVYHYDARVGTGVSGQQLKQFAGRGFTATIAVQLDGNKLYFKGSDFQTVGFNKRVDNIYEKLDLQYNDQKDPADVVGFVRQEFGKPFWADYENGVIKAIHFQADTSLPAINTKKALASLFQTNFQPLQHQGEHLYKVKEDGTGGDCQTLYKVAHNPPKAHPEYDVLNVTKIRFYSECTYHPHMLHSSVQGYKCKHCSQDYFKPLNHLGRADYQIKGTKQKFTIERIDSNGVIMFSPFSTNGETIVSIVNQTFTLERVEQGAGALPYPRGEKKYENLGFEFHNEEEDVANVDLKKAHYYDKIYHYDDDTHVQKAEEYLRNINTDLNEFDKNPETLYKLVKYFRRFSYDDFVQFFEKNVKFHRSDNHGSRIDDASVDEYDRRSYLFRVLPFVGTNPSILYMFYLIENYKMSMGAINLALSKFPLHVKEPSKKLLQELFDFKAPFSGAEDTAVLAFGTLIYKACVADVFNPHPGHHAQTYVDDATCKGWIDDLYRKYNEKKALPQMASNYVRALANTRHEYAFDILAKIAKGGDGAAHNHRLIAIFAMFPYVEKHSERVASLVAPIFYDTHEDHQIRIYAFEALLYSRPLPEFFGSLVLTINKEQDDKVANYIYATLATVSNTTDPCLEPFKLHARQALQFIPPKYRDIAAHGANRLFSAYNPKYNYGRSTHFAWVPSNSSFIPRDLYLRASVNVLGYNFDVFEVGTAGVPLDQTHELFKRIIGQHGLTEEYGKEHAIKVPHWEGERHPESNMDVYVKRFDQYVRAGDIMSKLENFQQYLDFVADKINLDELKSGVFGSGAKINIRSNRIQYSEVELVLPNEIGMPTILSFKVPVTYKLAGAVDVKVDIKDPKHKDVKLDFDLKLGFGFNQYASMMVYSKAFSYFGYKLKAKTGFRMPIKGSLHWDSEKHEVETTYIPSTEPYDVFYYDSTPYTFSKLAQSSLPVNYNEHATQRLYKFGHNYFGLGLKFNFTYDYHWNDYGSYRTFFKSFFRKPTSYEDYFYLADKYYGGTKNFLNYAFFNPTAKPFHFSARFEPSSSNPTNKVKALVRRLEKYTETSDDDHAFTEKTWHAEVVAKGPTERKWEADFNLKYNFPYRDHRSIDFHFKRSAIPEYDRNPFEVCYNSDAKVEELYALFTDRNHMKNPVSWNYKSKLFVGKDCKAGAKEVTVVGKGERSDEQKSIDYDKMTIYKQCKQDFEKGYEYSLDCWKMWKDLGRMDQFTFDVHFKNVPAEVKGFAYRIYAWFRHTFYNNLEIDYEHGSNEQNHIKVHANFSYYDPIVDVKIERPDHTVYYHNVYVPKMIPQFEHITVTEPLYERYLRRVFNYHLPFCIVSGDYVRTLDAAQYKADIGTCYHVAFADYDSGNLAVYVADHDSIPKHKKVKIALSEDEVKIVEEGGALVVYVDGVKKNIDEHVTKVPLKGFGADAYFKIYKVYSGYVVQSRQHEIYVFFDGKNLFIRPHFVFRGHPTGMCGHFDGNANHEFVGPDGTEYDDAEHFAHSFAVKEGSCTH